MKVMIKKHPLPMSLSLRINPMKEEHEKRIRDDGIIAPSVSGNTEDESDFQRINRKATKSWFKSKKSATDQSICSRTMIGGHSNEEKMTRSMEENLKKNVVGEDFEFGAGRSYGLHETKENQFVTFSADHKKVIKFPNYEEPRLHVIECKTKFLDNEQLKAVSLAR